MTEPHLSSALDEETARAELYGLIAELFYAPARSELLAQLRQQLGASGGIEQLRNQTVQLSACGFFVESGGQMRFGHRNN